FWAHITGNHDALQLLTQKAVTYHGRWKAIHAKWKAGDTKGAQDDLEKLKREQDLAKFLGDIQAEVKDARVLAAIAQIVGMLAITLVTMGVGAYVAGVAQGLQWGARATLIATSAAEAAAFTALNAFFFEKKVTAGGLIVEVTANFVMFGALKRFSQF